MIKYILIFYVSFIPFYSILRFSVDNIYLIPSFRIILLLLLCGFLFMTVIARKSGKYNINAIDKSIIFFLIYVVFVTVPLSIANTGVLSTLYNMNIYLLDIAVYFVIRTISFSRINRFNTKLIKNYIFVGTLAVFYQLIDYVRYNLLGEGPASWIINANKYMGYGYGAIFDKGFVFDYQNNAMSSYRIPGLFGDVHASGLFIVAVASFIFYIMISNSNIANYYKSKIILLFSIVVMAFILSGSRTAILSSLLLLLLFVIFNWKRIKFNMLLVSSGFVFIGVMLITEMFNGHYLYNQVKILDIEYVSGFFSLMLESFLNKYDLVLSENLLFLLSGTGFYATKAYTLPQIWNTVHSNDYAFVNYLSYFGVIGVLFFLIVPFTVAFKYAVESLRYDPVVFASFSVVFIMFLSILHADVMIRIGNYSWYWVHLAIIANMVSERKLKLSNSLYLARS